MKTGAIIQARMGSTRLPGKIMKNISGQPLLWHVVDRLKRCNSLDEIIIATTTNEKDNVIDDFANNNHVKCYRGSEEDVLGRYLDAAKKFDIGQIVRITSDCPLIDPGTVDILIEEHKNKEADYSSNTMERTYPRGLDTEVFSTELLEVVDKEANETFQREHVTPYLYQNPDKFNLNNHTAKEEFHRPEFRLCVDTPEDFELIKIVYEHFYNPPNIVNIEDVIGLLDKEPDIAQINVGIRQKGLHE